MLIFLMIVSAYGYNFPPLQGYDCRLYSKARYLARHCKKETHTMINLINYESLDTQTDLSVDLLHENVADIEFGEDKLLVASQMPESRLGYKFSIYSFEN